jgi:hypothetical protein
MPGWLLTAELSATSKSWTTRSNATSGVFNLDFEDYH